MNGKLITAALGGVAYGAVMAWAATADYYERRLEERLETARMQRSALRNEMQALSTQVYDIQGKLNIANEKLLAYEPAEMLDGGMVDLVPGSGSSPEENQESDSENSPGEETAENSVTDGADDRSPKALEDLEEFDPIEVEATRDRLRGLIEHFTGEDGAVPEAIDRQAKFVNDKEPPFVISRQEFSFSEEAPVEYDKITLFYHEMHRIVLDDDEEVVDDVANTLGWKNLRRFGDESGDSDVVFIRNHRQQTDYEVVRELEKDLPIHVKYGMGAEEFRISKAAGVLKLRPEDRG